MSKMTVEVPDIGGAENVDVIEVSVAGSRSGSDCAGNRQGLDGSTFSGGWQGD